MCLLRHRLQNGALSADIADEEADGSLQFELGTWSASTCRGSSAARVSGGLGVDASLKSATVFYFIVFLR